MKVLVLCHAALIPSKNVLALSKTQIDNSPWRTEGFVAQALHGLGHEFKFCGLLDTISPLRAQLKTFKPDVVFNLLEEFSGETLFEPMLVSYLNWLGTPVTGGSPTELLLTKNKIATKCILQAENIATPSSERWPKIVKYVSEDSSRGITDSGVVNNEKELRHIKYQLSRKLDSPIFAEEYVEGREFHCGVIFKNGNIVVSRPLETDFGRKPGQKILTERAKWDFKYRAKMGIELRPAKGLTLAKKKQIFSIVQETAKALELTGPARLDLRLDAKENIFVIEVNTNPDLAEGDEFAQCFEQSGWTYPVIIETILESAISRQ
jgi:D-alanine-D-alanine ligase